VLRVEVSTVPGQSAGSVAAYAHDLEQLAAASGTWGHAASPGRAHWWAQTDAQPSVPVDDPHGVTRGYQRDGLDSVLRDLDGGAA
jgi:hypothetical protein